jgi:hypothetical protein
VLQFSKYRLFHSKGPHQKVWDVFLWGGPLVGPEKSAPKPRLASFFCLPEQKEKKMFSWAVRCCSRWAHCVVWWPFGARMLP